MNWTAETNGIPQSGPQWSRIVSSSDGTMLAAIGDLDIYTYPIVLIWQLQLNLQGPAGALQNTFLDLPATITLGNGIGAAVQLTTKTITITTSSKLWALATINFTSTSSTSPTASFYMTIVGGSTTETSITSTVTIGASGTMTEVALQYRTVSTQIPGTYTVTVYGYASAATAANVTLTDLFVIGNLA